MKRVINTYNRQAAFGSELRMTENKLEYMNAYKYILGLLFVTFLTSCSDLIEEEPMTFKTPSEMNSEDGVSAMLTSAYGALQQYGYYKQDFIMQAEMRADYMTGRGSYNAVGDYRIDATNIGRITNCWDAIYVGVNRANIVIGSVGELAIDEGFKAQSIAEAKVLRALNYYNLVRTWGAVPMPLDIATNLEALSIPRSNVEDVYAQITKDLTDAINSGALVEEFPTKDRGRATVYAAKALLADVYLTIGEYQKAADESQDVIESNKFALQSDLSTMFSPEPNATHSGEIWSITWIRQGSDGNRLLSFMHNSSLGYSRAGWRVLLGNLNCPILKDWDNADLRRNFNMYSTPEELAVLTAAEPMLFKKFIDVNGAGQDAHGNDQPIYRYADVLTVFAAAECMANNGPTVEAYEAINQVRRRGYGVDITTPNEDVDYSSLSQDEFMDAVWTERAREFIMEGKRWYDMKRMPEAKAIALINAANKQENFTTDDWLYPIPQGEIDNNDALTNADQNPGY
jgi:hypothetical protein